MEAGAENDQVEEIEDLTWAELHLKREAGDGGREVEADGKDGRK